MACASFTAANNPTGQDDGGAARSDGSSDDDVTSSSLDASDSAATPHKHVFATNVTLTGAEVMQKHATVCQTAGRALGGSGEFVAWLSLPGQDAKDRVTGEGPWYLADNSAIVAKDRAQLTSGALSHAITLTEEGLPFNSNSSAWTGTTFEGVGTASQCNGWVDADAGGTWGNPSATDRTWTESPNLAPCSMALRLICFER